MAAYGKGNARTGAEVRLAVTGSVLGFAVAFTALGRLLVTWGTFGVAAAFALALIGGWTVGAAFEAVWQHPPSAADAPRGVAWREVWARVGEAVLTPTTAGVWLTWLAAVFVAVVGGWLLQRLNEI